ncbi:glycosyltransferase family 2 protein [Xanthomonas oryzae]|uniref:glycosyltransferase family 2 protein n=1 Tax=Xanthomonas oryzae TaxID=347 RepID=UPI001FB5AD43|nr:glycosyltransferase [Xanthomonas oryzae]
MDRPRILHCITVYNGRAFVPAAIKSALRLDQQEAQIDVLVLDDASPEPGWSEELSAFCKERGVMYYCTPRNLGIPRNVSLGMLTAVKRGYDYVVISNSDVLYPRDLMGQMLRASRQNNVGSVTAWSNNVSLYSLPNEDPNRYLHDQNVVDWMHATLAGHFGDAVMDIPAGISFCILISTDVVRKVGIMDPCFGRGYCEETDWSLRSLAAGYRIALAPGTYVFHHGRGSNLDAGLVSSNATTVPANEAIIDLRYPQFRNQVEAFVHSGVLSRAHDDAISHIVRSAGKQFGYSIDVGWIGRDRTNEDEVNILLSPNGANDHIQAVFRGFRLDMQLSRRNLGQEIRKFFGQDPTAVNLYDSGALATALKSEFANVTNTRTSNYPERV